jgi:uncharacterized protein
MTKLQSIKTCPICKTVLEFERATIQNKYFPFCSARCQKIDLGAWAKEEYRVETVQSNKSDLDDLED